MATQSLASMIVPHPCNKSQEDRNWAALNSLLQIIDQIIVINIDEITNEVTFNIQNITNISVTNIDVTTIEVTNIEVTNNLNVTNIYVTNIAEFVTIDVTTIDVTTINVTYITSYSLTYNILISVYGGGTPVYVCPTICTGTDTGTGSGGAEQFNECCDEIGVPETLTVTFSNKTGDCSCLPASDTMSWIDPHWEAAYAECAGCSIKLECVAGSWSIQTASCVGTVTPVSASCFPFELVFDVNNGGGGVTNCTGSYRVTITG